MIENISRFYKSGITVYRKTSTQNDIGDYVNEWNEHLEIEGVIRPLTSNEAMLNNKNTDVVKYILYCAVADITELDEIEDINSTRYRIIGKPINPMNFDNHFQIPLERMV